MEQLITADGTILKQVGVTALRSPSGEFLPAQPIYAKVAQKDINPESGMTAQEEKTLTNVSKIFAEKFSQYVGGCKAAGLEVGM